MNSLQVPHTFNHFECRLSNGARTCCNFSHCMTLENCSLITGLSFFLFLSHSPPEFPFFMSFYFPLSLSFVLSSSMCQCAVTFSQRAVVFGAVKWTCVAWTAQMRCPQTLWPGQTLDIWYVLLSGALFLLCLISGLRLSPPLTKRGCVFDFNHSVVCIFCLSTIFIGNTPLLFVWPRV